ncbi:hypothetical protein F5Y10DRAFT_271103 [Nemania abortiva]|nr:hypothetical protein F5Y10DRAFT_271103 [Nemania abortiva]
MATTQNLDRAKTEIRMNRSLIGAFLNKLGDSSFDDEDYGLLHNYFQRMGELEENPSADVEWLDDSIIILFLRAIYKRDLNHITKDFEQRYKGQPYVPGLPQATHVSFTQENEIDVIETSTDIWRYNKRLRSRSSKVRTARLREWKTKCGKAFCAELKTCSEELKEELGALKKEANGDQDRFLTAVKEKRSKLSGKFHLTGETIKPNGDLKPPRFDCYCRFGGDIDLPGMDRNLKRSYELDGCAEVGAMYARQAKANPSPAQGGEEE